MRFPTIFMCDQQKLSPACAYAQTDQSLCWSLEYSMTVKLLTEHGLDFLSLKGGCTGLSESIPVKMPHCWKSHVTAQMHFSFRVIRRLFNRSPFLPVAYSYSLISCRRWSVIEEVLIYQRVPLGLDFVPSESHKYTVILASRRNPVSKRYRIFLKGGAHSPYARYQPCSQPYPVKQ